MTAWKPISPKDAIKVLEAAEVGVDPCTLLVDLAQAGLVKGYARLIERPATGQEVRDSRIDRELWKQIVGAGKVSDIYISGTVRIDDATVIGIRFDEKSVRTAATEHGAVAVPAPRKERPSHHPLAGREELESVTVAPVVSQVPSQSGASRPRFEIPEGAIVLDTKQAAAALCIGKTTLVSLANKGLIERRSVGRRTVYTVVSIRAYLGC